MRSYRIVEFSVDLLHALSDIEETVAQMHGTHGLETLTPFFRDTKRIPFPRSNSDYNPMAARVLGYIVQDLLEYEEHVAPDDARNDATIRIGTFTFHELERQLMFFSECGGEMADVAGEVWGMVEPGIHSQNDLAHGLYDLLAMTRNLFVKLGVSRILAVTNTSVTEVSNGSQA